MRSNAVARSGTIFWLPMTSTTLPAPPAYWPSWLPLAELASRTPSSVRAWTLPMTTSGPAPSWRICLPWVARSIGQSIGRSAVYSARSTSASPMPSSSTVLDDAWLTSEPLGMSSRASVASLLAVLGDAHVVPAGTQRLGRAFDDLIRRGCAELEGGRGQGGGGHDRIRSMVSGRTALRELGLALRRKSQEAYTVSPVTVNKMFGSAALPRRWHGSGREPSIAPPIPSSRAGSTSNGSPWLTPCG